MSEVLGLPTSTILSWARSGLLSPRRDPRGGYVFSFQDIAVLRSARNLLDSDVSARRVHQALKALREQLPPGRPLSAVNLSVLGGRVLVQDRSHAWEPDTGQLELGLASDPPTATEAPGRESGQPLPPPLTLSSRQGADDWYDLGVDLEAQDPVEAAAAYRRALQADPNHADAHLNLGRLLHEDGRLPEAEAAYRASLTADPSAARAAFNLGVVLEDQGRVAEAQAAYRTSLEADPLLAVAHFNLSRLHEAAGNQAEALHHLVRYKRILDGQHGEL